MHTRLYGISYFFILLAFIIGCVSVAFPGMLINLIEKIETKLHVKRKPEQMGQAEFRMQIAGVIMILCGALGLLGASQIQAMIRYLVFQK